MISPIPAKLSNPTTSSQEAAFEARPNESVRASHSGSKYLKTRQEQGA